MKKPVRIAVFALALAAMLISACGAPAATPAPAAPQVESRSGPAVDLYAQPAAQEAPAAPASAPALDKGAPAAAGGSAASTLPENATIQTGEQALTGANDQRMVIKNADVKLLVEQTDTAIDRAMQIVGDTGGYIISSRVWYQDANGESYKFASLTIGVPVDQFETAARRLRGLALRVLDENATGQDVTSEYVDLQSQLGNLEATRDRIRSFLDNAKTIEESLRINQELTTIEAQIEQVKGRMNFLSNRSAYSTITVTFQPDIPPLPTPTITPTPTAIPSPTPVVWNPGETTRRATKAVTGIYQGLVELAIWFFLVIIPVIAPPALVLWGIYKLINRGPRKSA